MTTSTIDKKIKMFMTDGADNMVAIPIKDICKIEIQHAYNGDSEKPIVNSFINVHTKDERIFGRCYGVDRDMLETALQQLEKDTGLIASVTRDDSR